MVSLAWTDFKALSISKGCPIQMDESSLRYDLFFTDGDERYECVIYIDTTGLHGIDETQNTADKTDFETNYKSDTNKKVGSTYDPDGFMTVNTPRYRPKYYVSKTDIALSDTVDTDLADIDVDGQIDAISVNFDRNTVEFVLEIDGTEVLRIALSDAQSTTVYDLLAEEADAKVLTPVSL